MHYKDIETFLELVRTRNITKTAEHLYLSQSTISNRLKNLEDELGYQLIVRAKGHRAIQLTQIRLCRRGSYAKLSVVASAKSTNTHAKENYI